MPAFKFPKLYKRFFYSSCSNADSKSAYLNKRIDSFLFDNISDSRTLLSTHAYIISTGNSQNRFIASKLIASYASLSQPHISTKVFNCLNFRDPFLWNSIIKAHFSNGNYAQAIEFFSEMRFLGNLPNQFTIPMVVSACAELRALKIGMAVHGLVSKVNLFHENSAVGASLVYMYSKCGEVEYASHVFDEIPQRDVIAWTALVIGYVQNGESEKGLKCLCEMHRIGGDDERPNFRTLEGGLQACGDLSSLVGGKCLHGLVVKFGISSSRIIQSAVLSMYSKCGSVEDAQVSFMEVVSKDLFSWTSIIGIYARLGRFHDCFRMFSWMLASGVYPDGMVISCLVSGLANSMKVNEGKAFHGNILRRNYGFGQIVSNSLLSMYCKFGLIAVADKIFIRGHNNQETESWNIMVVGYEKSGLEMDCVNLFREMQRRGIESNLNTLMSVIFSCLRLRAIHFGLSVHCHIIKRLFENVSVVNSLINMYGRFGNLTMAQKLFHQVDPDIATWNSLISAHTENGNYFEAINFFDEMISKDINPNVVTLVTLLSACSQIVSLENGRKIHNYVKETGFEYEVSLSSALVDMYAKCGEINTAKEIFDSMDKKDVISWNVMISGYGMHGHGKLAIWVFRKMEESGARPNELTFLAVLSACAHSGLVDEAKSLFDKMEEYSVVPTLKHYGCMVDLYGRAGYLDEAESLILSMPFAPDGGIWGSLLTACKMHNNAEMGIKIAERAIEADPENDGYRVLISDFYGCMGTWEEVEQVRKTMKDRGVKKTMGWSAV
ncbi:pentatricopeptide repeat-containing protein at4g39952 mitochondrial [Phtheirospermum japonicum]|uniref:Pentatricopeptide repeat-containing protein at4g39952 mitochondrial n=1 Tax=Phtheirospermum japonicum TaxID=374723 RepID=A0A830B5L3_9LAMI|nr:pentatricopeptide repeat-containing protein at4g39952 mitochondrial [Phtheirospermum japonicum]